MSSFFARIRFRNPMRIESLRQRIGLLVLMPVGFMLVLVGVSGFVFMRGTLFGSLNCFDFKRTSGVAETG
jgi:hypothetical protein